MFGFWPKLLTEKINPDAQKIVAAATGNAVTAGAMSAPTANFIAQK